MLSYQSARIVYDEIVYLHEKAYHAYARSGGVDTSLERVMWEYGVILADLEQMYPDLIPVPEESYND